MQLNNLLLFTYLILISSCNYNSSKINSPRFKFGIYHPKTTSYELVKKDEFLTLWRLNGEPNSQTEFDHHFVAEFHVTPKKQIIGKFSSTPEFRNLYLLDREINGRVFEEVMSWNLARLSVIEHDFEKNN